MRVTGGDFRGRIIKVPRGYSVRPTSSRVREALFSMVADRVPAARVLDLFAGSGVLGIEALSRGAVHAVFVERSKGTASVIIENLRSLEVDATHFEVVIADAFHYLNKAPRGGGVYDIIFIDPPYGSRLGEKMLGALVNLPILSQGGVVLNEMHRREAIMIPAGFRVVKEKRYGDTSILMCARNEGGE